MSQARSATVRTRTRIAAQPCKPVSDLYAANSVRSAPVAEGRDTLHCCRSALHGEVQSQSDGMPGRPVAEGRARAICCPHRRPSIVVFAPSPIRPGPLTRSLQAQLQLHLPDRVAVHRVWPVGAADGAHGRTGAPAACSLTADALGRE